MFQKSYHKPIVKAHIHRWSTALIKVAFLFFVYLGCTLSYAQDAVSNPAIGKDQTIELEEENEMVLPDKLHYQSSGNKVTLTFTDKEGKKTMVIYRATVGDQNTFLFQPSHHTRVQPGDKVRFVKLSTKFTRDNNDQHDD